MRHESSLQSHRLRTNPSEQRLDRCTLAPVTAEIPAPTALSALYTVSQKNIPDIFDCNMKKDYQILIIFGRNIPETTCHQVTI